MSGSEGRTRFITLMQAGILFVIPAKAGIQQPPGPRVKPGVTMIVCVPAFAGEMKAGEREIQRESPVPGEIPDLGQVPDGDDGRERSLDRGRSQYLRKNDPRQGERENRGCRCLGRS
jgi:hypothetical protein